MVRASRRRMFVLYAVVVALLVVLAGRLWNVQVLNASSYKTQAAANQTRDVVVPAPRGEILGDDGQALVTNSTSLTVSVNMTTLGQRSDGGKAVLQRLATLLGTSYGTLSKETRLCGTKNSNGTVVKQPCWNGSPYQPIPVKQNASPQTALQIMEEPKKYPGVSAQTQGVPDYPEPDGANPAQVLGYTQPVNKQQLIAYEKRYHLNGTGLTSTDLLAGQSGLESQYNSQLTGAPGTKVVSVNAAGGVTGTVKQAPAEAGDTLVTSINPKIQADAQQALNSAIAKARGSGHNVNQGSATVMTTSGRVVAMASYPNYNPNVWSGGISRQQANKLFGKGSGEPVVNWATQGQYAPGSTWKITTAAAAVKNGDSVNGQYNCPATVNIGGRSFANDGEPSQGYMSLGHALAVSCDTVFYGLAYQLWQYDNYHANFVANPHAPTQKMQQTELAFGFGQSTGVDLPSESLGAVPTRQWLYNYWKANAHQGQNWCANGKRNGSYVQQIEYDDCTTGYEWLPGQAVIAAIGQGYVSVTPLQLADAYVALANGGTLYSPRVGKALIGPNGKVVKKINPPVIRHLPVSSSTLSYIANALQGTMTYGTAAGAFSGFPLNKVCVAGKTGTAQAKGQAPNSVFASFAPCGHPKYVVVVMVPGAGYGADVSAPAVRQIWDGIYGLEGHKAAVPGGQVPSALPTVSASGKVTPPKGY